MADHTTPERLTAHILLDAALMTHNGEHRDLVIASTASRLVGTGSVTTEPAGGGTAVDVRPLVDAAVAVINQLVARVTTVADEPPDLVIAQTRQAIDEAFS